MFQHPQAEALRARLETAGGAPLETAGIPQTVQTGSTLTKRTKPSATFFQASSGANNNAQVAVGAPCDIHAVFGVNKAAAERNIRIYNMATTPSAANTPVLRLIVPPGPFHFSFPNGVYFGVGVGLMYVTGSTDADNTAVAEGDILGLTLLLGTFG